MVGRDAQLVHLGPDRLEHGQRCHEIAFDASERHRLRAHPLDPGDVEPEGFGAAGVPRVRRHEQHVGRLDAEFGFDRRVGLRARLENLLRIDAQRRVQHRIETAVLDQRVQHVGAAVGQDRKLASFQRVERFPRIRIEIEMPVLVDDRGEAVVIILQAEAAQRVGERVARHHGEIRIAPHQRAQPAIFELLDAPDLRDDLAIAGECLLGDIGHRLHVVERAIGVEHDGFDGQFPDSLVPMTSSRNSRNAAAERSAAV